MVITKQMYYTTNYYFEQGFSKEEVAKIIKYKYDLKLSVSKRIVDLCIYYKMKKKDYVPLEVK